MVFTPDTVHPLGEYQTSTTLAGRITSFNNHTNCQSVNCRLIGSFNFKVGINLGE
jgi:hypothetical protein